MNLSNSTADTWAIELKGLSKSFGFRYALKKLDLQVAWGESIAVFGHNGAGKTTLIKIIASIMNPSSGSVSIGGQSVKVNAIEVRRRIGVVTHQTYLNNNLTGYENLSFYAQMYDVSQRKDRIHEVADMFGMTSRLHDRVGTLSRGMQQRLSISRALLHNPEILLLDEPEAGLDLQVISKVWNALGQEGENKRTIVLATHNLERGLEVSDRFVILSQGEIVFENATQAMDIKELNEIFKSSVKTTA